MTASETKTPIAHVDESRLRAHELEKHLLDVAKMASAFASPIGAGEWAATAGLWHDLGKFGEDFQNYIRSESGYEAHLAEGSPGRVNHSSAGALYAKQQKEAPVGRILSYLIAGHHAGLSDWFPDDSGSGSLEQRLEGDAKSGLLDHALAASIPPNILTPPPIRSLLPPGGPTGLHLWMRMLFSCLVDADFLDTESFMDPPRASVRTQDLKAYDLLEPFNLSMQEKADAAPRSPLNEIRADILKQCRDKATGPEGIYTLTVPTGGGKTLSSLAFALEHAWKYQKSRIIYAIPFTSIIEQTADIFRGIFGGAVIEHHSNLDPKRETPRSRLASENWDAPLVVTTNVQFFESLFAARTSRCRKLHNIANSVVVLDEAHLLPPEFLRPILDAIRLLADHYRVTFVLCSATQPALKAQKDSFGRLSRPGLDTTREIIDQPADLFRQLRRTEIVIPKDLSQTTPWEEVAAQASSHERVLVIVNTRRDCRTLHSLMPPGTVHLSALMCGQHRSRVIASVKRRLLNGEPVRVVSTQLIEAGVDIDFPTVFRALCGLDSIAQAAGRCNRENSSGQMGKVVVFVPPGQLRGMLRFAEQATRNLLQDRELDLLAPETYRQYFKFFFAQIGIAGLDKFEIVQLLTKDASDIKIQFKTAAMKFQLIDESQSANLVVPYKDPGPQPTDSRPFIERLKKGFINRELTRALQRFTVSVYKHDLNRLLDSGVVSQASGYFVLEDQLAYDDVLGLRVSDSPVFSPEAYII